MDRRFTDGKEYQGNGIGVKDIKLTCLKLGLLEDLIVGVLIITVLHTGLYP